MLKVFISSSLIILALLLTIFKVEPIASLFNWLLFAGLIIVWLVFLFSLMPNQTPVITSYAVLIDGELTKSEMQYTRFINIVWVGFLSFFIIFKLYIFINKLEIDYLVLITLIAGLVLFVGEFYLRKLIFKNRYYGSLINFIQQIIKLPIRQVISFKIKQSDVM